MKKISIIILLLSTFHNNIIPQSIDDVDIKNVKSFHMAPEVSSFSNSGRAGIDYYTGKAIYNIPLYNLKADDLEVPVTITYSSSGVQVDKLADWAGMDWNLSAGGSITREVKGLPDETPVIGYYAIGSNIDNFYNDVQTEDMSDDIISFNGKRDIIKDAEKNDKDLEPDVYYYNFGNYSGKFIIDYNQNVHLIPYHFLIIQKITDNNQIKGFVITTPDGNKYTFGNNDNAIEKTTLSTVSYKITSSNKIQNIETKNIPVYNSGWGLTKITSPRGKYIDFEYQSYDITYVTPQHILYSNFLGSKDGDECNRYIYSYCDYLDPSCTLYLDNSVKISDENTYGGIEHFTTWENASQHIISQTKITVNQKKISKMTSSDGNYIVFNSGTGRDDLPGGAKLTSIDIYSYNNTLIKSYMLNYDFVQSTVDNNPFSLGEAVYFKDVDFPGYSIQASAGCDSYVSESNFYNSLGQFIGEGLKLYNYYRMFLTSITETTGASSKPPISFTYKSPENLGRRTSVWVDYYGFDNYNTCSGNFTNDHSDVLLMSTGFQSASNTNGLASQNGLLKTVTTPLGLKSEFFYEGNYSNAGCRVAQIINTDDLNNVAEIKNIKYPASASDIWLAKFRYYLTNNFFHEYFGHSVTCPTCSGIFGVFLYKLQIMTSYNLYSGASYGNDIIGYAWAKAENSDAHGTCKGKEKFIFYNNDESYGNTYDAPNLRIIEWDSWNCTGNNAGNKAHLKCDDKFINIGVNYPYAHNERHSLRGILHSQVLLDPNENKIKETVYDYTTVNKSAVKGAITNSYLYRRYWDWDWVMAGTMCDNKTKLQTKYFISFYNYSSDWNKLEKTIETTYNPKDETKASTVTTNYDIYNNYGQVSSVSQTQSDGTKTIEKYKYVSDFIDNCNDYGTCLSNAASEKSICEAVELNNAKNYCQGNANFDQCVNTYLEGNYIYGNCTTTYNSQVAQCDATYNGKITCKMVQKNMLSNIIEKQKLVEEGGIRYLTNGELNMYQVYNNNLILPSATRRINILKPTTDITECHLDYNNDLIVDPAYTYEIVYDKYDSKGNLLQYHKVNSPKSSSYIWGYNQSYPVAQIVNASNSNSAVGADCGYIGFESGNNLLNADNNYWNLNTAEIVKGVSHTGSYSAKITGGPSGTVWTVSRSFNPSDQNGKYVFSAWVKSGCGYDDNDAGIGYQLNEDSGGALKWDWQSFKNTAGKWQYVKIEIDLSTVASDVTINLFVVDYGHLNHFYVDDVRFCPVNSEMTTYNFEPLVGQTSVTDAANKTTFYDYDALGRLLTVRNDEENILKEYKYHYAGNNSVSTTFYTATSLSDGSEQSGPDPDFTCSIGNGIIKNGEAVSFTAIGCGEAEWNFGDGTPVTSGSLVNHTYNANLNSPFTVTMTMRMQDGSTVTKSKQFQYSYLTINNIQLAGKTFNCGGTPIFFEFTFNPGYYYTVTLISAGYPIEADIPNGPSGYVKISQYFSGFNVKVDCGPMTTRTAKFRLTQYTTSYISDTPVRYVDSDGFTIVQ